MRELTRRLAVRAVLLGMGVAASGRPAFAQAKVSLAIRGFDPVAYFTDGRPMRGLPTIAHVWDEHVYHFVSVEHRDLFKADPVHYAPQFAGFCGMALTRAELDDGDPENWLVRDDKLFLFGKAFGPGLFQQGFDANVDKAGGNLAQMRQR